MPFLISIIVSVIAITALSSCSPRIVNVKHDNPTLNGTLTKGVGEVFFTHEVITGEDNMFGILFNGRAHKFDLTISSLSDTSLRLAYSEYTKPPGPSGGFVVNGSWIIKAGFNKSYDYDLSKTQSITFKEYVFNVVKITEGKLTFKRVK